MTRAPLLPGSPERCGCHQGVPTCAVRLASRSHPDPRKGPIQTIDRHAYVPRGQAKARYSKSHRHPRRSETDEKTRPLLAIADISCSDKLSAPEPDVCNLDYQWRCTAGASLTMKNLAVRRCFGSAGIENSQAASEIKQNSAVACLVYHHPAHFHSRFTLAPSCLR